MMKAKVLTIVLSSLCLSAGIIYAAHVYLVAPTVARYHVGIAARAAARDVTETGTGDYKEAETNLDIAEKICAQVPEIYLYRGHLKLQNRKYQEAIENYDRAVKLKSDYGAAFFNRAFARHKSRDYTGAIQDYNLAIKYPHGIRLDSAYLNRGLAHEALDQEKQALSDFDSAIAANPKRSDAYLNRAHIKYSQGRRKEALVDCNAAVDMAPDADTHFYRGQLRSEMGDEKGALADFETALAKKPDHWHAAICRGSKLIVRNRKKEALDDLNRGAAATAKSEHDFLMRGYALFLLNRLDKAEADYKRALLENKDYYEAYTALSSISFARADYKAVVRDCDKALALKPYGYAYMYKTTAQLCLNDPDGCLAGCQEWIKKLGWQDVTAPYAALTAAVAYHRKGDDKSARRFLRQCKQNSPADEWPMPLVLNLLGEISKEELDKELTDPEKQIDAHFVLGIDAMARGRKAQAKPHFQWLLAHVPVMYPDYVMAQQEMRKM